MSSVPRRLSHGIDVAICFFSPNHPTLSASPYRLDRPPPAPPLSLPRPTLTITITPSRHRAAILSLLPHNYTSLTALPSVFTLSPLPPRLDRFFSSTCRPPTSRFLCVAFAGAASPPLSYRRSASSTAAAFSTLAPPLAVPHRHRRP
jgi:hypothetical protein